MTPNMTRSMNPTFNPLYMQPESTHISLLSQMSTGSHMDGAHSKRKAKANSADEFPFGILDKDDQDEDQLDDLQDPKNVPN